MLRRHAFRRVPATRLGARQAHRGSRCLTRAGSRPGANPAARRGRAVSQTPSQKYACSGRWPRRAAIRVRDSRLQTDVLLEAIGSGRTHAKMRVSAVQSQQTWNRQIAAVEADRVSNRPTPFSLCPLAGQRPAFDSQDLPLSHDLALKRTLRRQPYELRDSDCRDGSNHTALWRFVRPRGQKLGLEPTGAAPIE
jgi:hypothetical protein